MFHFCTISTSDFLYRSYALFDSIAEMGFDFRFHLLGMDAKKLFYEYDERIIKYGIYDLNSEIAETIKNKYHHNTESLYRSLKPIFISHLLENKNLDTVIYLDNDIAFFDDYRFLFELLKNHSLLLSPNNYQRNPNENQNWLEANFRVGLFNAGFIGASRQAVKTLNWWAECCAYRCEKNTFRGFFYESKYLDLVPVIDEQAHVLRHLGCTVADWNSEVCKREIRGDRVLINSEFPVICVQFNSTTIRAIAGGQEPALINYFEKYMKWIHKYNSSIAKESMFYPVSKTEHIKLRLWKWFTDLGL